VVVPVAEQLDRAHREILVGGPLNGRIGLILVDNALELMCHQKATEILERDRASRSLSPEQRADARGQVFGRKVAILKDLGHIPIGHVRAITIFHRYRNQLYHVGLRNDPVVGHLAGRYFELTVGLMSPLLGVERHLRWEPTLLDDTARRLCPELATAKRYRSKVSIVDLADRLMAARPSPSQDFQTALREHLSALIDLSAADFAIIAKGRSGTDDPEATFRRVQLEHDTLAALIRVRRAQDKERRSRGLPEKPLDEALMSMARGMPILVELNSRLLPNWRPRHARLPFETWRKQTRGVGARADALQALDGFDKVLREIEHLDEVMAEPIDDMHGWNQHMEDVMMDRR
jgi:hypothetical protein